MYTKHFLWWFFMNIQYFNFLKKTKKIYKNINWLNKKKILEIRLVWLEIKDEKKYSLTHHFFNKNNLLSKMNLTTTGKNLRLNCIDYWLLRGFSEEIAKKYVSDYQSNVTKASFKKYGCSVSSRKFLEMRGLNENEINIIMQNRDRVTFADLPKDTLISISKKGSEARKKQISTLRENNPQLLKTQFNTTIEYYISRNYSYEESVVLRKSRQTTFSLEKLKEKLTADDAFSIWQFRQQKWQNTLNNKSDYEKKQINLKKAVTLENLQRKYGEDLGEQKYCSILKNRKTYTSKESTMFFNKVISQINLDEYPIWSGSLDKKEYFLYDSNLKKFYFYDFVLKNRKIIVEYHGESFHPRKDKLTPSEWCSWKMPFTNESADSKFEFDQRKNNFAKSQGFVVVEIWSSDSFEESLKKIVKLI